MRLAICLSGLHKGSPLNDGNKAITTTDWKLTCQNIFDTFKKYETDYFIHSWNSHEQDEMLDFYQPKDYNIEEPIQFNPAYNKEIVELHTINYDEFKYNMSFPLCYLPHRTVAQFYGIKQVDTLRKKYELHHNFKYDLVIRCRFDLKFNVKIELEPNKLQFMKWVSPTPFGLTDMFYAGTRNQMTIINRFYDRIYDTYLAEHFIQQIHKNGLGAMHLFSSHAPFYYYIWKSELISELYQHEDWIWNKTIEIIRA